MKAPTSLFAGPRSETLAVLPLGTTGAIGAEHLSCAKAGAASMTKAAVDRQIPRVILVLLRSQALKTRYRAQKKWALKVNFLVQKPRFAEGRQPSLAPGTWLP